jgi:hypothetical protein
VYRERERAEAAGGEVREGGREGEGGGGRERDGGTGNDGLPDFGLVVGGCPRRAARHHLKRLVPPHVDQGVSNLAHPTRLHPAGVSHGTTGSNAEG